MDDIVWQCFMTFATLRTTSYFKIVADIVQKEPISSLLISKGVDQLTQQQISPHDMTVFLRTIRFAGTGYQIHSQETHTNGHRKLSWIMVSKVVPNFVLNHLRLWKDVSGILPCSN